MKTNDIKNIFVNYSHFLAWRDLSKDNNTLATWQSALLCSKYLDSMRATDSCGVWGFAPVTLIGMSVKFGWPAVKQFVEKFDHHKKVDWIIIPNEEWELYSSQEVINIVRQKKATKELAKLLWSRTDRLGWEIAKDILYRYDKIVDVDNFPFDELKLKTRVLNNPTGLINALEKYYFKFNAKATWYYLFGRCPENKMVFSVIIESGDDLYDNMEAEVINYSRAVSLAQPGVFKGFMTLLKKNVSTIHGSHEIIAAARLAIALGPQASSWLGNDTVHEMGINLPDMIQPQESRTWLLKNKKLGTSTFVPIYSSWEELKSRGIDLNSKNGVAEAKLFLASRIYTDVKDEALAIELGAWGYSQETFTETQELWLKRDIAYETIPTVDFIIDDYRCYIIDRDDPRALTIGQPTGCCQHITGVGKYCAWHSAISSEGRCFVMEKRGIIKVQSWLWRNGDCVIADNVEGNGIAATIEKVYKTLATLIVGRLCIKEFFIGAQHSKVSFDELKIISSKYNNNVFHAYSDADRGWVIRTSPLISEIKKLEKELYSAEMRQMQDIITFDDLAEFCEGEPTVLVKKTGYLIYTNNEIVDMAFKDPKEAAWAFIHMSFHFEGKTIYADLRRSTSYKAVKRFESLHKVDVSEQYEHVLGTDPMVKCKITFRMKPSRDKTRW